MKHFHCGFRVQQLNLHKNWLISFLLEKKSEILQISVIDHVRFTDMLKYGIQMCQSATIQFRIFCFTCVTSINLEPKIYQTITLSVTFCLAVKLSVFPQEHNTDCECFEASLLKGLFRPMREEVRGVQRKLHNQGIHEVYSPTIIIRLMKLRKMRFIGEETHIIMMKNTTKFLSENRRGRNCLTDAGVDGRVVSKCMLQKYGLFMKNCICLS